MPAIPPLPLLAAGMLLGLAACAAAPPSTGTTAPPPPADPAPSRAATAAEEPLPPVTLAPRAQWTRIRIDPRSGISAAWRASPAIPRPGGKERRWIVGNLREPIRLPETGGRARSVAFLADYHCDQHAWEPVEIVWFARPDARDEVLRERPHGSGERRVREGTLVDVFLDAACGRAAAHPRTADPEGRRR